jgi:sec-independent protein translocase protein TatA
MRGISVGSLLLIAFIVIILFGTKRLKDVGNDLGAAVRGFKKGLLEESVIEEKKKDE